MDTMLCVCMVKILKIYSQWFSGMSTIALTTVSMFYNLALELVLLVYLKWLPLKPAQPAMAFACGFLRS